MNSHRPPRRPPIRSTKRQRGVVLLFALIALVIMLIAAVAMVRSFQSSLFAAGNVGFKRDMRNQSELAVSTALGYFRPTGALNSTTSRANFNATYNYNAQMLPSDTGGIPNDLVLSDSAFNQKYSAGDLTSLDGSVTIRYVIDRLCSATGDEKILGSTSCMLASNPTPAGGSVLNLQSADKAPLCPTCSSAAPQGVVYRLSIKVTGPRNTQSFFQSTFTVPS